MDLHFPLCHECSVLFQLLFSAPCAIWNMNSWLSLLYAIVKLVWELPVLKVACCGDGEVALSSHFIHQELALRPLRFLDTIFIILTLGLGFGLEV